MQAISRAKSTKSLYDFNSLLKVANIFLCILSIYLYSIEGDNEYVNQFTVVLAVIIGLENIGMLVYEKRRRNPFVIIIVFLSTIFYLARITTLIAIPLSAIFERDSVTSKNLNYALLFIILCNASMFFGFYIRRVRQVKPENEIQEKYSAKKIRRVILILVIMILMLGLNSMQISGGGLISFIIELFFHQQVVLLFSFVFFFYYYGNISGRGRWQLGLIILAFVFFVTLSGSRNGILGIGTMLLMSMLVVKRKVLVSKWIILSCIILIPISIFLYIAATFNRGLEEKQTNAINVLKMMDEQGFLDKERVQFFLGRIFERIGFLDFSTSLIANSEKFSGVVNPIYYSKSIVDNVLTPGFDVFNTPRVSHALGHVAIGQGIPTRDTIAESYQSDQMGIYGEYYILFLGYPALVAFFSLAYIFQWVYDFFRTKNYLLSCLYRVVLLDIFLIYMNSFGTDWIVLEIIGHVCTALFFSRYYNSSNNIKKKNIRNVIEAFTIVGCISTAAY